MAIVEFRNVCKTYHSGALEVAVLKNLSFAIDEGQFIVLLGPSGSGKSTLLNLVGGLDVVTSGSVHVCDQDLAGLDDDQLSDFRGKHIGFVFQSFNLIPVLTAAENIAYPLLNTRFPAVRAERRVDRLLKAVGLHERGHHLPGELSGGQRQRARPDWSSPTSRPPTSTARPPRRCCS